MGIPSYYRTLVQKVPHSLKKTAPTSVQTLVVDMNCMIYHILKEPQIPAYPGEEERLSWEYTLQKAVCSYLKYIWVSCGSPSQVYIALDGVVPYAKIKQQRFRRFKSSLTRNCKEWDTNAITPGTQFMESLAKEIRKTGHGWILSDTEEPGEGEQKVLRWLLNTQLRTGPIVIYGLDADLILLGLLAGEQLGKEYNIYLLRESQAFGTLIRSPESNQAELCYFTLSALSSILCNSDIPWTRQELYDYVFGMSFCGNDFLPTGLSLRIRDDGHSLLLQGLRELWKHSCHLVSWNECGIAKPNPKGLLYFSKWMASQEERCIIKTILKKQNMRISEKEEDALPILEQAEAPLVQKEESGFLHLKKEWKTLYSHIALGDSSKHHRKKCVEEYWKGWCWILDYYQGIPIDYEWVYAHSYPPTWNDLVYFFNVSDTGIIWEQRIPCKPQEQLALVLPLQSWWHLYKTPYWNLPLKIPQFWASSFQCETFGKLFGWECEPNIPMFSPARLRYEMQGRNPPL